MFVSVRYGYGVRGAYRGFGYINIYNVLVGSICSDMFIE